MKTFLTIFTIIFCTIFCVEIVLARTEIGGANTSGAPVELPAPINNAKDPNALIGQVIGAMLGITGSLALVIFIYGGFMWMTAAGESGRVQKGKDTMLWGVLGLVVIFTAYSIINFVLQSITGKTG